MWLAVGCQLFGELEQPRSKNPEYPPADEKKDQQSCFLAALLLCAMSSGSTTFSMSSSSFTKLSRNGKNRKKAVAENPRVLLESEDQFEAAGTNRGDDSETRANSQLFVVAKGQIPAALDAELRRGFNDAELYYSAPLPFGLARDIQHTMCALRTAHLTSLLTVRFGFSQPSLLCLAARASIIASTAPSPRRAWLSRSLSGSLAHPLSASPSFATPARSR